MVDFMGMMKQAAELKSKMEAMQAELDNTEVEGVSGGGMVSIKLSGKGEMKSVRIDESLIKPSDREILEDLIAQRKADAFFTCGSNRLLKLMQRLGKKHGIPGQVAMEQIMVCGFGACYVCMRTFEVDGQRVLRRVCRDGPVFNMQEAVGW